MEMSYRIPKLRLPARLSIYALCEALGIFLQIAMPNILLGTFVMIAGLVFLARKPYTNKPADLGFETWKPVSVAEVDRISDNLRQSSKIRVPFYFKPTLGIVLAVPLVFIIFFILAIGASGLALFLFDAYIVLIPFFFFGRVKVWIPRDLSLKMKCFQAVLSEPKPADVVITPYLRFDKDKEDREIPEDVRIMVERKRKPEDFVGVQMQAAINNGPNGAVPYLYAVCLCRGKAETYRKLSVLKAGGYVVEAGGDKDYGTVVIRQQTGGGGYCTTPDDCRELFGVVLKVLEKV